MILRPSRFSTSSNLKAPRQNRSAFTLLEVLVVVAIIVMLASVGGYYFMQQYADSQVRKAKIDCEGLSSLCETFKLNNGNYPTSIEQLAQAQPSGGSPLSPPDKLKDPWGKPYQLDPNGPHNSSLKCDVFTVTPQGKTVGNFSQ
jgi:general secretion pathway protein G